jgi:hypothetical protein
MPGAPAFHRRSRRAGAWPAPERQAASARVRGARSTRLSHRSHLIPGSGKIVCGNCGKCGNPCLQCGRRCCRWWQAKRFRREWPGNRITFVGRLAPTYRRGSAESGCGNCANRCMKYRRPCCGWQANRFRRKWPGTGGSEFGCGNCANRCMKCRRPCCGWQANHFRRESPRNRITFVGRLAPTYPGDGGKPAAGIAQTPRGP